MIFSTNDIVILLSIITFAAFVHGSIGFGFPMVATPMLAMATDLKSAILITLIPTLLLNMFSIVGHKEWKRVVGRHLGFASIALLGSVAGTILLLWMNASWFKLLLAAMILLYLSLELFRREHIVFHGSSKFSTVLFAFAGGILGGLTNVMAPILIIYTLVQNYSKEESTVFLNLSFLLGKISQIMIFVISGKFIGYLMILMATISALLGFYLGSKVKSRINEEFYKKVVKVILFAVAVSIILRYINV